MTKKRKNWLEKFQAFWWGDLTYPQRRCLWEVLTALRGPDRKDDLTFDVKKNTTARIRYLLLGKIPRGSYGFVREEAMFPYTTEKSLRQLGYHFYSHIYNAIESLRGVAKRSEMKDLLEIFEPKDKTDESNQSAKSN